MATQNGSVFNNIRTKGAESIRRFKSQLMERGSAAIFVILALVTIAVLIAFLVMKLKAVNTKGVLIVGDPLKLYGLNSQARVDHSNIPPTVNGQEFSFSFWLYLVDFQQTNDGPQFIFMRSGDTSTVSSANPLVALDGRTNKMYVAVRTNAASALTPMALYQGAGSGYLIAAIDYFPLQRWVNVVGVVKDDTLSVYMNSALYTVANVSDLVAGTQRSRPVFTASTGSIVVGASGIAMVREARAYITQFKFFNYALTPNDINAIYSAGPASSSFFAKLGLTGYGLRSPIYRVDA